MSLLHKSPCYNCSSREIGCHALCSRYAEYAEKNEEIKKREHNKRIMDTICYKMATDAARRRKKRKHLKGKEQ